MRHPTRQLNRGNDIADWARGTGVSLALVALALALAVGLRWAGLVQ